MPDYPRARDRAIGERGMSVNYKVPHGTLILPVDASREEWLKLRTKGVGGTDIATLMGANKYQTVFEAWQDKQKDSPQESDSEVMWWGQQTEALTAKRFEEITGLETRRAGTYASKSHAHHVINVDRLTSDGGVLEIKDHESLSDAGKTVLKGDITAHAWNQLQWAMHVTGRSHGWFAAKVGKKTIVLGPFARDDAHIEAQKARADWFWQHVTTGTEPPIDYATVTADEVATRFPTAEPDSAVEVETLAIPEIVTDDLQRLRDLKAQSKALSDEQAAIETRLKAVVGDREYLTVGGRPALRWQPVAGRRTFDKAAAVKTLAAFDGRTPVEIEEQFTKQAKPSRRLSLIEDKKEAA